MKTILLIATFLICSLVAYNVNAQTKLQTSPFHHIPKPKSKSSLLYKTVANNKINTFRFVLPFAGYSPITRQISTGIGYGWNRLHWVDSIQTYYTDLSVFGAIFINGDVTPTPYNFTSVGVGVGLLNGLINICPAYNLPSADKPGGAFDLKISFGLTLK